MSVDANSSTVTSSIPVFIDYNLSQITPLLYVTAADTAQQFDKIFSNGIVCVINVAEELPQLIFPPQSGIESIKFPIQDFPSFPASSYFDIVADRIDANVKANRRTLLYCHQGRSRSITFILAYLIKHHQIPLPTAYALVKEKRQIALPNIGFWSQLKSYEETQHLSKARIPIKHENSQQHHQHQHHHHLHHHHSHHHHHHHHHHREHQALQRNPSNTFRNVHNSHNGPQQFFHKISDGFNYLIKGNPLIQFFSQAINQPNPKVSQYPSMRRRHHIVPYQTPFSPQLR